MSFHLLRFLTAILVLFITIKIVTVSAAPLAAERYIVEEQEPLVWCDEDYPILDANDPIDTNLDDDVDDDYY